MSQLLTTPAPHVLGQASTSKIMWTVNICLLPAIIWGGIIFGWSALLVLAVSVVAAVISEWPITAWRGQGNTIKDGSAVLTGLLIGLSMPPTVAWYVPAAASVFAIVIVKQLFGGLGCNWFNPAMAARTLVSFVWVKEMTIWAEPFHHLTGQVDAVSAATVDAVAGATPLELIYNNTSRLMSAGLGNPADAMKYLGSETSYWDLFIGLIPGSIGEVSALMLILGSLYLFYKKIITWDLILSFLLATVLAAWIIGGLPLGRGYFAGDPLFFLLAGSTMMTAIFIITDMVTCPVTSQGRIIFGAGVGLLTVAIKEYTYLPEGSMIAVLVMNALTPIINRLIKIKPIGYSKQVN